MLMGCYYRCPVVLEEGDRDHPRFFVLAQALEYNELADAIKVKMHDILGSREYYSDIFSHNVFYANAVTRCEAMPQRVLFAIRSTIDWRRFLITLRSTL